MKTKLFMFLMAIGMLVAAPTLLYAQGYTDDDFDFNGSDVSNDEFGPVSTDPVYIKGNVSYINQEITLDYQANLGTITIWIVDEKGTLYISEEVNTVEESTTKIDIKALPAQKYTIICFNKKGQQKAEFELLK